MFKHLPWIRSWRSLCIVGVLAVIGALLAACGGSGTGGSQPAAAQAAAGGPVTLEIGTAPEADVFKYDKATLEAPAGSKITLKFTNNTRAEDEIGHNWVLVKPGQEQSVVDNGKAAGDDKDWINVDDPGIIADTKLIEGGESDTITFDAPAPGTYTYLSTFPEQYAGGMKGTLTIK